MGLIEIQVGLARLYTDAALRERFAATPLAVGRELGLDAAEATQLAQLSTAQLNRFANSLLAKRRHEVAKLLPLTCQLLGANFAALFERHADASLSAGSKKHLADALNFDEFLRSLPDAERCAPPCLVEVLRYEEACLRIRQPRRLFVCALFRHDIVRLCRSLRQPDTPPYLLVRPTLVIWSRRPARDGVRQKVFYLKRAAKLN